MNTMAVLEKAWRTTWRSPAQWLFGAILALTSTSVVYPGWWLDQENHQQWTIIKLTDSATLRMPGPDLTVDLTSPRDIRINPDAASQWRELSDLAK
jgi:hypothetical protein